MAAQVVGRLPLQQARVEAGQPLRPLPPLGKSCLCARRVGAHRAAVRAVARGRGIRSVPGLEPGTCCTQTAGASGKGCATEPARWAYATCHPRANRPPMRVMCPHMCHPPAPRPPPTYVCAGHEDVIIQHHHSPVPQLRVRLEAVVHGIDHLHPQPNLRGRSSRRGGRSQALSQAQVGWNPRAHSSMHGVGPISISKLRTYGIT